MKQSVTSFIIGILLGILFVILVHTIPPQPARQIIALLLAFTACVYAGAVLAQKVEPVHGILELSIAVMVFSLAVVGLRASTTSLALGYIIHGIWDLFHHPKFVRTKIATWFPPLCSAFDFVVAIALLIGPWRPVA
jgi:uncharacterized membrane protein HdeD (DUF308 family)